MGVSQGCLLSPSFSCRIKQIHFHSLNIYSYYHAKFKENPSVGTDESTPLVKNGPVVSEKSKFQFSNVNDLGPRSRIDIDL